MDYNNLNKYQTKLSPELISMLPKELYADLIEFIETVPYIKNLIQPEEIRGTIEDRPVMVKRGKEDPRERKKIDICNPHILDDMSFFRERALFYKANGKYTNIPPNGNPKSEFAAFWREELNRWKVGLVRDDGEWIPGYLYFYWNYSPIYLAELEEGEDLSDETLEMWVDKILKPDDDDVQSREPGGRVQEFPKPWLGDYLFYHYVDQAISAGKHGKLLKARGVGFSLKLGSLSPCNMYIKPGSGNPNFHLASEKTFLTGDKGIWGKVIDTLDWIAKTTPLAKLRLVDRLGQMEVQLGYQDKYGVRRGLLSSVFGISMKDNPDKARGIRGPLIHYEEDGLFPNLENAWNVNRKAVEDGSTSFGFMLAGGTGGVKGGSFEGSEKLFYTPGAFNIYSVPNVYDKNVQGSTKCGFFWPAFMNRNHCYDEVVGEPDVIKALLEILADRRAIRNTSSDPTAITQRMAEEPIVPQEAIMRVDGTLFPVADIKGYLSEIEPNITSFLSHHYVGELIINSNREVSWEPTPGIKILREFPITDNLNKEGGVEIFTQPYRNQADKVPFGRYIAGMDPIDDDSSTTNSLFSMFVWDLLTDTMVAEYTGRARTAEISYNIAYRLIIYYNALCNYENDKKGFFAFMRNKHAEHMICDTPEILKAKEFVRRGLEGNKAKGTPSGKMVNALGRRLQADWLLKEKSEVVQDSESEDGERTITKMNLHTLRSTTYLKELQAWNPDGNFDRVSAMNMVFILREDMLARVLNPDSIDMGVEKEDKFWSSSYGKTGNSYNSFGNWQ